MIIRDPVSKRLQRDVYEDMGNAGDYISNTPDHLAPAPEPPAKPAEPVIASPATAEARSGTASAS